MRCLIFLLLLQIGVPIALRAQIDDPQGVFETLKEMDGAWFMETERGDRMEIWDIVDDSTMTGRGLRIKLESRDTVLLETLRLELRGDSITYWALARGQNNNQAVPFQLTEVDEEGVWIFENPKHDDPVKIRYWLLDNQELQVTTEGRRNGRDTKTEFVFEREFTKGSAVLRLKVGLNWFNLLQDGNYPIPNQPVFEARPGWDVGIQIPFGSQSSLLNFNVEAGFSGRYPKANASFTVLRPDTVSYLREVGYRQIWFSLGVIPEFRFTRSGRFSILLGPTLNRLLYNDTSGNELPGGEFKTYDSNNDFRKNHLAITGGFQYRFESGRRKRDAVIGVRSFYSFGDVDNLYRRACEALGQTCTSKVRYGGLMAYYGVNLIR